MKLVDKKIRMNKKELEFILSEGEGQFIEFKEKPDKNLAREIVAFTNSGGGRIFLGIKDDTSVIGIKCSNKLKSQIQNIGRNCDPSIILDIQESENIIVITVPEGINKPYACYLRMGANSQKLKRDEIFNFAIKSGKIRFDEQICNTFDWVDFDNVKFDHYSRQKDF